MERIIEMSIENFRAIKKADIELNGITVVSGINGCGKTTMSKMLYYIFKNTNDFESLAISYLQKRIRKYISSLEQAQIIYQGYGIFRRSDRLSHISSWDQAIDYVEEIRELATSLELLLRDDDVVKSSSEYRRLIKIFQDVLGVEDIERLDKLISGVKVKINEYFSMAESILLKRPYSVLKDSLYQYFPEADWKGIKVKEYGSYIMEDGLDTAVQPHFIQKAIYIDSPMTLKRPIYLGHEYDSDLIKILINYKNNHPNAVSSLIKDTVIKGEAFYDGDAFSRGFSFKDSRGRIFDLNECATGVRSFSIIQMLLDCGFIDENCLLIIDEPEAHLHPQWIIEYARMIVLLRKTIKAKFFIASHSTDMVEALRSLSESEGIESDLRYYLGEEKDGYFSYRDLGLDIEPIFASFNKSFDRLEYYTSKEQ